MLLQIWRIKIQEQGWGASILPFEETIFGLEMPPRVNIRVSLYFCLLLPM